MIRDAAEADLPAILAITNDAIANTTAIWTYAPTTLEVRTAWWTERVAGGFPVLVAAEGDTVLGFASYGPFRPSDGYLHTVESSIYIAESARGRGLGRALVAALLSRAAAQGKHVMIAGVEASNTASLRLHAGLGFVETGRLLQVGRKFDRWLDLVLMQRMLA
ncbi:GNAT family N-acetyltransferase [Limobrevibacterium gyesilva]|uniref:GNAT family N-acetyltransferase n=1 Tax=Limobrevibacterium gyesilva TaxID=2991712 RepID=A0AA41YNJ2_9PROT|nr:GNAT family N-acetyltransferase [Limobrevibacterium gyesilva]MCW3475796.1 GNAT family N-acetyltransferase [Limobrevibacterium gyesilva]